MEISTIQEENLHEDEMSIETLVDLLQEKLSSSSQKYSFVKKKIKELELALIQVKQNTAIPEISLQVDLKITEWIEQKKDIEELIQDAPFINKIQSDVNVWIKEIQRVTLLSRDPSEGTARQEIEFWLQMETSLSQIEMQLKAHEILYTLDVLKAAKRFHATVSFIADTGIKDCMDMVLKYNLLMKDFPINDLLSAPDLEKIRDSVESIFNHFTKKLKISPYPIKRALPLAEQVSLDMTNQILSIMPQNLLSIPYSYFITTMKQASLIFDTWDECLKEFVSVCRDVSRKRSEKFIPVKVVSKHATLQERITYIHNFRVSHQQLVSTIEKVVSNEYSKSSLDDLGLANATAIVQVNSAMDAIKSVNVLDVSIEGTKLWSLAEESYVEKISVIEHSISTHLQSRLELCKSAQDMFRVFKKFNVLFVRPKIRGAIHEYQTRLVDRVKDDIKRLHERFMKDSNREALLITKGRDIPSLSGSIIWAKGIERQLGEYMKKVENVLGKGWQLYAQGQQLEREEIAFRKQLDTKSLFQQWVREETSRKPAGGKIFAIKRNKLRGNQLELEINFDPKSISVFKDVRNLSWLGFSVPIQIQNIAKDSKRIYPFAVSLDETLRIYRKTLLRVNQNPQISMLVASYHSAIQTLIAKGTQLRWEYFTGIAASENRQAAFVRDLAIVVTTMQEKTFSALHYCEAIDVSVGELSSVPYDRKFFTDCLTSIQSNVDKLNFESFSNLEQWNSGLDSRIENTLLERLTIAIKDASTGVCFQENHSHSLQIKDQSIFLDPPLENARMNWIQAFNTWTGVITTLPKVKVFAYTRENNESIKNLTYNELLQRVDPELLKGVYELIESMYTKASAYVGNWLQYQSLWDLQPTAVYDVLGHDLELWCLTLAEVKAERSTFDTTKSFQKLQAITVYYGNVQAKVNSAYDQWQRDLIQQFSYVLHSAMVNLNDILAQHRLILEKSTLSATQDMVDLIVRIKDLNQKSIGWSTNLKHCFESQRILERQRFQFPSDWLFYEQVAGTYSSFSEILNLKTISADEQRSVLELRIRQETDIVATQISEFMKDWASRKPIGGDINPTDALLELNLFHKTATSLCVKFKQLEAAKNAIDFPLAQLDPFEVVLEELEDLKFVWNSLLSIWSTFKSVKSIAWLSEECWNVKSQLESLDSILNSMPNKVRQYVAYQTMLESIRSSLNLHIRYLPLKSDALRDRHWVRILSTVKLNIPPKSLTVEMVWNTPGFKNNDKTIEEIIFLAQGEMSLETFLSQVRLTWDTCKFEFVNFQNKLRLVKGWDDLFSKCQDHLSALAAMKNSVHFKAFQNSALHLEDSITRLYSLLDVWVKVQRQWVYLQGIFNDNQDIKLMLPMESSRFASVDNEFLAVLRKVYKIPLVLDIIAIPSIMKTMERLHDLLNGIQKSLGEYLERERSKFARFYFVADEDLLEILGNSKDLSRIEPHLKKMFTAINQFVLTSESDISGILSKEGEQIAFRTSVSTKSRIHVWISQVEKEVAVSLHFCLLQALRDSRLNYFDQLCSHKDLLELITLVPCQILILASQIHWTKMMELAFSSEASMKKLELKVSAFVQMLAEIVVLQKDQFLRRKTESLITEVVHQRDVIRKICSSKIGDRNNFYWLSHLRIYLIDDNVFVKIGNSSFKYGFEYLGLQDRLVQTPLTDRCYLTLTQALYNKLGGSPFGPAGTGKTESVKSLASQLGRHCLVFCCDESFDFQSVGRIFVGLVKVGAWGCFDEFNRLDETILSAVSQQIQEIQCGLREGRMIDLVGTHTEVHQNTGIFITMNPDYAGRSTLPINLTSLFRAVSMTIPDRELIAQVMLFSQGFRHAEALASKAIPFFDILREQLSNQKHYDFGLRALKSVLISAGKLQRENIFALETRAFDIDQEEITMIRSIRETVFPKLVKDDMPVAEVLLRDVFTCEEISCEISELESVLYKLCDQFHIDKTPEFIQKVIQLNTIQQISHGCMLVGRSGTGKTAAWKLLFKALERIRGDTGSIHVIDPKSISKDKLYGSLDHTTREWTDGIFTKILRDVINDVHGDGSKTHWIIFDGEVDPEWVENLNSVLDDNKMLTLPNGERLPFMPNIKVIFEVESLDQATPATVSRCGMIWFPEGLVSPAMLSFRFLSLLKSRSIEALESTLSLEFTEEIASVSDAAQNFVIDILEKYLLKNGFVEICLIEALKMKHIMPLRPIQALENLFALLSFSIKAIINYNDSHPDFPLSNDQMEIYFTKSLFLHLGWAFAGGMLTSDRAVFGKFVSKSGNLCMGADMPSIFDMKVDLTSGEWLSWSSSVPAVNIESHGVTRHDLVIPTVDTLRHESILYAWLSEHKSLILCGPPGSGKTMSLLSSLRNLPQVDVVPINFSSETSCDFLIKTLEIHCNYKKLLGGETLSPKIDGRWVVLFCDEINLPKPDKYGTQRVISFLRQLIERKGFWRGDRVWVSVEKVQIVGACNPPTDSGRIELSERFLRHSPVVYVDYPGEESLITIYGSLSRACLQTHPALLAYAEPLTSSMVNLYMRVKSELTAEKCAHYIFSPRELTRWIRGIYDYLVQSDFVNVEDLIKIWAHEAIRLFQDRIADCDDRHFIEEIVTDTAIHNFPGIKVREVLQYPIFFSTLVSKTYQASDRTQLMEIVKGKLKVYYEEELHIPLVLYDSALDHILRIDRVFRQVQGHLLLIGLSGSGKSSLTRFVCWMNGLSFYKPSMHSKYSISDFEDDLRTVLKRAGCKGESVCFMLDETNMMESSFLERINTLLANAEIPGLFEGDDFTALMAACKEGSVRDGLNLEGHDQLYRWFTNQIAKNLHVVFSMNPPTGNMSIKVSSSPALFNRCVLNWMGDWGEQAFLQVAKEFTIGIDLSQPFEKAEAFVPVISLWNSALTFSDVVLDTLAFCHFTCRDMLPNVNSSQASVNPKQYMDFCNLFSSIYLEKRSELEDRQRHIIVGLDRLEETVDKVTELRSSLSSKNIELEKKSVEANEKLKKMVTDQQFAENKRSISLSIKKSLAEKYSQIAERRQIVQEELDLAEPAVIAAQQSVSSIKKQHLTELRSMGNPPNVIKLAMESVCILLGHKVETWKSVQAVLRKDDFISSIVNYDTMKLSACLRKEVYQNYILDPAYNFDNSNRASKACGPLVNWVIAQVGYGDILEKVGPLREELLTLEDSAKATELEAEEIQQLVANLESSISIYKEEYAILISEVQSLKAEMAIVKDRVDRSVSVLEDLSSERKRWSKSRESFGTLVKTVVGDSLLTSSFLSYAGIFDQQNRQLLVKTIKDRLSVAGIPFQANLSLPNYLTTETERSEWYKNNLPSDSLCVENAVMLQRASRYPLIIDPSGQAVTFLKSFYKEKSLAVTSFRDSSFLKVLESALRFGNPILIEDSENLDSIINGILNREIRKSGGRNLCKLGKKDVDFSPNFQLFLSTKNESHCFSPDISCRVSFVNFTMTPSRLQSQCLNEFLLRERPDIEGKRRDLLRMQGEFQLRLHNLEKQLLDALNKSTGNILDDEEVLKSLETLKREAAAISLKSAETENVLIEIESVTSLYEPLAELCSSIYFCVENFTLLRKVYQFSLVKFFEVFDQILQSTTAKFDRVSSLRNAIFSQYFIAVSRSLWYGDTHLLALMLAQISEEAFDDGWKLFLKPTKGVQVSSKALVSDLGPKLSSKFKQYITLPSFRQLQERLKSRRDVRMSIIVSCSNPEDEVELLLSKSDGRCTSNSVTFSEFHKFLLLQCLRPDRVLNGITKYVNKIFGLDFLNSGLDRNVVDLMDISEEAKWSPFLLVHDKSSDPSHEVENLAMKDGILLTSVAMGSSEGFQQVGLAIAKGLRTGGWVLVKNAHLAIQWLISLEKSIPTTTFANKFRLFITLQSHDQIPMNLIRSSKVMVFEPPMGMKQSLIKTLNSIPKKLNYASPVELGRLMFMLAWMHSIITERSRYTPIGWTKNYDFNYSDFEMALILLVSWVEDICAGRANISIEKIPWEAIQNLISRTVYGGKIDNQVDQELMDIIVRESFSPSIFEPSYCLVSINGDQKGIQTPNGIDIRVFAEWASNLPSEQSPHWLSLPAKANFLLKQNQGSEMMVNLRKVSRVLDADVVDLKWKHELKMQIGEWLALLPNEISSCAQWSTSTSPLGRYYEKEYRDCKNLIEKVKADLMALKLFLDGGTFLTKHLESFVECLKQGFVPWSGDTAPTFFRSLAESWKFISGEESNFCRSINLGAVSDIRGYLIATRQESAAILSVSLEKLVLTCSIQPSKDLPSFEIVELKSQCCQMLDGKIRLCEDIGIQPFPSCFIYWSEGSHESLAKIPVYRGLTRKTVIFHLCTGDLSQTDITKLGAAIII